MIYFILFLAVLLSLSPPLPPPTPWLWFLQ